MTYQFSAGALSEIQLALTEARLGSSTYANLYATILSNISTDGAPKDGVDAATWHWLKGATLVNFATPNYHYLNRVWTFFFVKILGTEDPQDVFATDRQRHRTPQIFLSLFAQPRKQRLNADRRQAAVRPLIGSLSS